MTAPLAVLTAEQLAELVEAAVTRALAARFPTEPQTDRMTIDEAAAQLRCTPRNVRKLISKGLLRAEKAMTGGSSRMLVSRRSLEQLLTDAR